MNALNLKLCVDFGVGARRNSIFPARTSSSSDLDRRPLSLSFGTRSNFRLVACAAERNGNGDGREINYSAFLLRSETYAFLKQQLVVAAQAEDYKEAARIRDLLRAFGEEEPFLRLHHQSKEAIVEGRWEDGAKYFDELRQRAPHYLFKCSSDATTEGIRVQVRSVYIENRSQPLKGQYFFEYRVRITNNSERSVQLVKRHWIITDTNGNQIKNVGGMGEIDEQPVILPKTGYDYSSTCSLSTPNGRMEGEFQMKYIDDNEEYPFFYAYVARFSLSTLWKESEVE